MATHARAYYAAHGERVESLIAELVTDIMSEQPADPGQFLLARLQARLGGVTSSSQAHDVNSHLAKKSGEAQPAIAPSPTVKLSVTDAPTRGLGKVMMEEEKAAAVAAVVAAAQAEAEQEKAAAVATALAAAMAAARAQAEQEKAEAVAEALKAARAQAEQEKAEAAEALKAARVHAEQEKAAAVAEAVAAAWGVHHGSGGCGSAKHALVDLLAPAVNCTIKNGADNPALSIALYILRNSSPENGLLAAKLEEHVRGSGASQPSEAHELDEMHLPAELRAFTPLSKLAEVAAVMKGLNDLDAALEAAPEDAEARAALADQLAMAANVLRPEIVKRTEEQDIVPSCDLIVTVGLNFFQGAYDSIFHTVEGGEGIEPYHVPAAQLQVLAAAGLKQLTEWLEKAGAKRGAMQRTGRIQELFADACSKQVRAGFEQVLAEVQKVVRKAARNADGAALKPGPTKHSARILEKVLLRRDDEGNADRVCDVRRALLVVFTMAEFGQVLQVFAALHERGVIVIVRVKDRIAAPAAGWRDVMINFYIQGDGNRHVCEVQVSALASSACWPSPSQPLSLPYM